MDIVIIAVAAVLAVIACAEIVSLFIDEKKPSSVSVLPVFGDDSDFPARLDALVQKGKTDVLIVDYSATDEQKELCYSFVRSNPDSAFISRNDLENYFCKTFAFSDKV